MKTRWAWLLALSVVISAIAPLALGGSDILARLAGLSVWAVLVPLAMIAGGWACNAGRLFLLVGALGTRLPFLAGCRTVVSAEFAGVATPAYAGGPATYLLLLSRRGVAVGQAAAVVALDQLTDLAFFSMALPIMAILSWREAVSPPTSLLVPLVLVPGAALLMLLWLPRHYRPAALWLGRRLRRYHRLTRLRWRLARWLLQFRRSVGLLLQLGVPRLALLLFLCAVHWLLRYGTLAVILAYLGGSLPFAYLFLVQSLVLSVGYLTAMPGGTGGVELGMGALLGPYLGVGTLATAMLLWRFATFHWYLLAGAPVFLLTVGGSPFRLRKPDEQAGSGLSRPS